MIHSANSITKDFTRGLNGVYAHGEVEDFLGYDVVQTNGLETYSAYRHVADRHVATSIHRTKAINSQGETMDVICYFWYAKRSLLPRGLIVCATNAQDVKYVIEQWANRVEII